MGELNFDLSVSRSVNNKTFRTEESDEALLPEEAKEDFQLDASIKKHLTTARGRFKSRLIAKLILCFKGTDGQTHLPLRADDDLQGDPLGGNCSFVKAHSDGKHKMDNLSSR